MANYLTPEAAAAYLGYSIHSLQLWRRTGEGPEYIKVNKRSVRYLREDLDEWMKNFGKSVNTTKRRRLHREKLDE